MVVLVFGFVSSCYPTWDDWFWISENAKNSPTSLLHYLGYSLKLHLLRSRSKTYVPKSFISFLLFILYPLSPLSWSRSICSSTGRVLFKKQPHSQNSCSYPNCPSTLCVNRCLWSKKLFTRCWTTYSCHLHKCVQGMSVLFVHCKYLPACSISLFIFIGQILCLTENKYNIPKQEITFLKRKIMGCFNFLNFKVFKFVKWTEMASHSPSLGSFHL